MGDASSAPTTDAFARRRRLWFWGIFLFALLTRVVFAAELLRWDVGLEHDHVRDMHTHEEASRLVLEGDWAQQGMFAHDLYQWHLSLHGADRLRERHGDAPLLHAPLYSYLLAGWRGLGLPLDGFRLLQVALSLLTCWLTYALARTLTRSEPVALAAFAFTATQPTLLLYAGFLLRATWLAALLVLWVWGVARYRERPSSGRAAAIGATVGVFHLLKGISLLLAPLTALAVLGASVSWRRRAGHGATLVVGGLVAISPLLVRNLATDTRPLHNGSFAPYGVAINNHPDVSGRHLERAPADDVRAILTEHPGSLGALLATIRLHPSLGSYLRLEATKLYGFVNGYEAFNNIPIQLYTTTLESFRLCPLSTAVLIPLALIGAVAGAPRWRTLWPLYAAVGLILLTCLLMTPLARYRLPALPLLAVFAALGLRTLWRGPRAGWARAGFVVALLVCAPNPDVRFTRPEAHAQLAGFYERAAKPDVALRHLRRAVVDDPLYTQPSLRWADSARLREYLVHCAELARLAQERDDPETARAIADHVRAQGQQLPRKAP